MDKKELGRRVNIARKDRGLTSEKLSELCHINATYLRQIEAGKKSPSLEAGSYTHLTLPTILRV